MSHTGQIKRVWATLNSMMVDRGGDAAMAVGPTTSSLAGEDVLAMAAGRPVFHVDLPGGSTFHRVIFDLLPRFKVADIKKILQESRNHGPTSGFKHAVVILIVQDFPNAAIYKGVMAAASATTGIDVEVQLFKVNELLVDVSQHVMVPKHEPVRDEATILQIMRLYKVNNRHNFPLIMTNDRMARHLALRHGELVRITRPSPSAGTYMFYRCCMRS